MKVELGLLSLILIVSCSAQKYELKCTEKESDILWPVYSNNAVYKRCADIGKPLEMKCNAGTLFSFVYQGCVLPDDYIPPPPVDALPLDNGPSSDPNTPAPPSSKPPFTLPTPQHPDVTEKTTTTTTTTKTTKSTKSTTTVAPPTAPGPPTGSPPAPPSGGPPAPPTPGRPTAGPGVPGPPSPPATNIPMPNTPAPTPPAIDNSPPSVGVTLPSDSRR